ncbi:MAG: bifunctional oligoribonuclease/PAP phosphatase NrnA [Firmicutes bacterium]|nr:bifunctional oligoribonuclease/PAP phosphatase NrnA [Bacillota bacterium]
MNTFQELVSYLRKKDNYILVGHEHPDPDSLGSMLGLYFGLKKMGKTCRLVSADPIPPYLSWPGLEQIEHIPTDFDPGDSCVIVLDCEPQRTGSIASKVQKAECLINIDHHERGRGIGQIVYVDPGAAATSVIVYRLLLALEIPLDLRIATALYGGIIGDTGGFRHANTTSGVFKIAAELVEYGVKPAPLAREIFSSQTYDFMRFLGFALTRLQIAAEGKLVWIAVSYDDFHDFKVVPEQTDHLVNFARMVDTAEIAMVFREIKPGEIRLGFRANQVDVGYLARYLGGGGHKLASGATLLGNFEQIVLRVVELAKEYLNAGEIDERNNQFT